MAAAAETDPLLVFTRQLGMLPQEKSRFGWIAEYGLQEEALPPRWTKHIDRNTGHTYYFDRDSHASCWDNPLTPALKRVLETGRLYMARPTEHFFVERKRLLWNRHKYEIECWVGPFKDSSGQQYFANSTTGTSSWWDPREEAQYMFELETSLLDSLAEMLPPAAAASPGPRLCGSFAHAPSWQQEAARTMQRVRSESSPLGLSGSLQVAEAWPQAHQRDPHVRATWSCMEGASDPRDRMSYCRVNGADILRVSESRLSSPSMEAMTVESFSKSGTPDYSPENRLQTPVKLQAEAKQVSIFEHKNAMEKLGGAAKWLHSKSAEEAEAQRSLLSKKMEARLRRKQVAAFGLDSSPGHRSSSESAAEDRNDTAACVAAEPCVDEPSGINHAD